jgi:exopolysaccharide production protein ExoQ
MIGRLILWAMLLFAIWAIRRDTSRRNGISVALWIPTLWVGIIASRPLSNWLGGGQPQSPEYSLEGSPIDALFFIVLILAATVVVSNRKPDWSAFFSRNWPIILFYSYLLISVVWAADPLVSFKRWFKEVGNIMIVMVILTEQNPLQAFRAVFVRCAYVLIPLSFIFVRYFPDLGRVYNIHSGELEAIGVTFQKNSLGAMILVTALVTVWDLVEKNQPVGKPSTRKKARDRLGFWLRVGIVLLGIYLLRLCDSKTSLVCLVLGGGILVATRIPWLKGGVRHLGVWMPVIILLLYVIDSLFGVKESVLHGLGRDMTFTGRTEVWHALLSLNIDPIIGTGFCSFWSDQRYLVKLPYWVAYSAHNGYVEIYIDGGFIAVSLLALLICVTAVRIIKQMRSGTTYAVMRYSAVIAAVVANFSESYFARMAPVGFLFLLAAVEVPRRRAVGLAAKSRFPGSVPLKREAEAHGKAATESWN